MAIKVELTKDALTNLKEVSPQFIPASIDGNGSIKIEEFNSYTFEENNMKNNSLRGYPLRGVELNLPSNLTGIVLREKDKLKKDDDDRELKFSGKFNKFLYWNYDKNPSNNDSYCKAMHWIDISESVHEEIKSLDD